MANLDGAILAGVQDTVVTPEFILDTLAAHRERAGSCDGSRQELGAADAAAGQAEAAVDRLIQMVAAGTLTADNPDLKRHMEAAITGRDTARQRVLELRSVAAPALPELTRPQIRMLAEALRRKISDQSIPVWKTALQLILDRIVVQGEP